MAKTERQYIGIQYHATGIFGYSFRENGTEQFNMNCPVLPEPDIALSGFGKKLWHRKYDGRITLLPGIRRNITVNPGIYKGILNMPDYMNFALLQKRALPGLKHLKTDGRFLSEQHPRQRFFVYQNPKEIVLRKTDMIWRNGSW